MVCGDQACLPAMSNGNRDSQDFASLTLNLAMRTSSMLPVQPFIGKVMVAAREQAGKGGVKGLEAMLPLGGVAANIPA